MLATDDAFPNENATGSQLYTITAGGFSASCDGFAREPETDGLWFLSMVGSQTALKAIWAALLKQPPEAAFLIGGAHGMLHQDGGVRVRARLVPAARAVGTRCAGAAPALP